MRNCSCLPQADVGDEGSEKRFEKSAGIMPLKNDTQLLVTSDTTAEEDTSMDHTSTIWQSNARSSSELGITFKNLQQQKQA